MAGWEILGCGGERRARPGAESVGRVEEVRAERGQGREPSFLSRSHRNLWMASGAPTYLIERAGSCRGPL